MNAQLQMNEFKGALIKTCWGVGTDEKLGVPSNKLEEKGGCLKNTNNFKGGTLLMKKKIVISQCKHN